MKLFFTHSFPGNSLPFITCLRGYSLYHPYHGRVIGFIDVGCFQVYLIAPRYKFSPCILLIVGSSICWVTASPNKIVKSTRLCYGCVTVSLLAACLPLTNLPAFGRSWHPPHCCLTPSCHVQFHLKEYLWLGHSIFETGKNLSISCMRC